MKETKKYKLPVIKYIRYGDEKYSIENVANGKLIGLYGGDKMAATLVVSVAQHK